MVRRLANRFLSHMSKPLKYGLIGAAILLLLLIIAPFLIPADAYRARIEQAAFERTGRVLKINGPLHVTLFPTLGVRAENVTFANVPGTVAPFMATMDDIGVGVRLLPLLGGHMEVSEIVLDRPVINLERTKDGRGNWTFKSSDQQSRLNTRFSGVRVNNGRVYYRSGTGRVRGFEHADLTIGLVSIDKPVTLDGDVIYQKRRVSLEARLESLATLKPNQLRGVDVSLTSDLLQASFKGDVAVNGDITGTLKADTTNIHGVAEWLNEDLPKDSGFKTLSLETRIETTGDVISLPEESLRLDGMTVTGRLSADLSEARPNLTGDVVVDRLDLNRYLERAPSDKPQNGWSNEPIDLAALKLFNANLTIDAGVVRLRGLHINKTHLAANLKDGLLQLTLDPMSLYGGTGKATLTVDARGSVPQFASTLLLNAVSMRALLNDALNAQRITGRGTLSLDVKSQGASGDAVIRALSGKGSLTILNGEILGVDLGGVARLIRGALTNDVVNSAATTPFSAMGGSFVISRGVLATNNFHMDGKVIRATGAGTVDLGNRTLDFVIKPKAVLLPIGTGFGVGFPFRAHGPWQAIAYTPDLTGAVTGLVGDVFQGALSMPGAVGDFLTGGAQQKPQGAQKKSTPKKKSGLLDGLFGH
jgi:AsmA protein